MQVVLLKHFKSLLFYLIRELNHSTFSVISQRSSIQLTDFDELKTSFS